MSLNLSPNIPANVVEIGQEVTQGVVSALNNGQSPDATNVFLCRNNTFTTSDAAVRITQTGAGEAFRVEDTTTPDTTPFVVTADGRVGIGTTTVGTNALTVSGNTAVTGTVAVTGGVTTTSANTFTVASGTAVPLTIQNNGTGNSLVVNDVASDTTPFVINADGNVGIGKTTPTVSLDVAGFAYFESGGGGAGDAFKFVSTNTGRTGPTVRIENSGLGASLRIDDQTSDTTPFIVDAGGNVGVKNASPSYDLDVNGTANVGTLRFSDGTTMTTAPSGVPTVEQTWSYSDNSVTIKTDQSSPAITLDNDISVADISYDRLTFTSGDYETVYAEGGLSMSYLGTPYFQINGPSITVANHTLDASGITFPDTSTQTTAVTIVSDNTDPGIIENVTYDLELQITVAGVSYAVPARLI